jgi:hypothetical protein
MVDHIHILAASGAGTSTLGAALAARFGAVHLDTDDYFWEPTVLPFQRPRARQERQARLLVLWMPISARCCPGRCVAGATSAYHALSW